MAMFFLTKLVVAGIKNIENPIEFEFYKKTINNDFNPDKYRIKAIYGENGSGKTAVITAVRLLKNIIEDKDYLRDSNTQKVLVDLVNKKARRGQIAVEFISDLPEEQAQRLCHRYSIGFEIRDDSRFYLSYEKLECKKGTYSKNSFVTEYEVVDGRLKSYEGGGEKYDYFRDLTLNLLDQQSFVATIGSIDNIEQKYFDFNSVQPVLCLTLFSIMTSVWIDTSDNHSSYPVKKELEALLRKDQNSEDIKKWIYATEKLMVHKDEDMLVTKNNFKYFAVEIESLCEFIRIFKPELKKIEIEKKDYGDSYKCNLIMVYDGYSLDKEFESRGIKKLMEIYDVLNLASVGGIAFIDELDSNINDIYLDKLIEYLQLFGKGQLCFTAHNLSPMSVLKNNKNAIDFISSVNSVHTWTKHGNLTPENAYRKGFIEDSPFNVDATDFIGILGKV